jgi:hypothetical protein
MGYSWARGAWLEIEVRARRNGGLGRRNDGVGTLGVERVRGRFRGIGLGKVRNP